MLHLETRLNKHVKLAFLYLRNKQSTSGSRGAVLERLVLNNIPVQLYAKAVQYNIPMRLLISICDATAINMFSVFPFQWLKLIAINN